MQHPVARSLLQAMYHGPVIEHRVGSSSSVSDVEQPRSPRRRGRVADDEDELLHRADEEPAYVVLDVQSRRHGEHGDGCHVAPRPGRRRAGAARILLLATAAAFLALAVSPGKFLQRKSFCRYFIRARSKYIFALRRVLWISILIGTKRRRMSIGRVWSRINGAIASAESITTQGRCPTKRSRTISILTLFNNCFALEMIFLWHVYGIRTDANYTLDVVKECFFFFLK